MLDLNLFGNGSNETDIIKIEEISQRDIAVIGMAVRMPMAETPDEFWRIIRDGKCCITQFPDSRRTDTEQLIRRIGLDDKSGKYRKSAYLEDVDKFDYRFFRISPNEASLMDPNQRQFLQTAFKAIEDAGYGGGKIWGTKTGVYLGYNADAPYTYKNYLSDIDESLLPMALSGNLTSVISGRISHILNLRGPSLAVDTACSSSLIAVHLACKALRGGECDMALAGGIKLDLLPVERGFKLGIESSDDRTKTFDDNSDGTAMGEGAAAVLLKPLGRALKDKDYIYAVIKGSAANQDGNTIGITAPSVEAQAEVLTDAWRDAGIDPATVTFIEAHGTGTKLGDPIEIEGITRAFKKYTSRKQFCAIGSLKTNIGHLDNAAGIAGFVKAVLSLKNKELPPSMHFHRPNKNIAFCDSPVYVSDKLQKWHGDSMPRRCGVSAFGLSGTNCHVVLEESPQKSPKIRVSIPKPQIFTLSAKSREAFADMLGKYIEWIKNKTAEDFESICYTSSTGRGHYNIRLAIVATDTNDLANKLYKTAQRDLTSNDFEADGIFFGEHTESLVTEGTAVEKQVEAGENIYGDDVNMMAADIAGNSQNSAEIIISLCKCYIKGAKIDWEELYLNHGIQKLPLPTYSFEKKRCWVKLPDTISKQVKESAVGKAKNEEIKVKLSGRKN
jgi:acyl transferase domain-containing protein